MLTVRCLLQLTKLNISTIENLTYSRRQRDIYFHEVLPTTRRGVPTNFGYFVQGDYKVTMYMYCGVFGSEVAVLYG